MHELSIVESVVDSVSESLAPYPGARVLEVRLRIGALAAVVEDSLQFCFGIAAEGTPIAGARLTVHRLPVVMHCPACARDVELEGVQSFRCPLCGELVSDLRQGRELEIESIEIDETGKAGPDSPVSESRPGAPLNSLDSFPVSESRLGAPAEAAS
jgi:hydrogenase nickel incorporation protein HypA/HybF